MKAKEVLTRYAAGERDFRRVNLRGQSFQGKDLSGADFSEADIRGTNFKNAILRETKFCKAVAGLQRPWAIGLLIVSLLLSGVIGCWSVIAASYVARLMKPEYTQQYSYLPGILFFIVLAFILIAFASKGLTEKAFRSVAIAVLFAIVVLCVGTIYGGFLESNRENLSKPVMEFSNAVGGGTGAIIVALNGSVLITIAGIVGGSVWSIFASTINAIFAILFFLYYRKLVFEAEIFHNFAYDAVFIISTIIVVSSSIFIAWGALGEDKNFILVREISIALVATRGTSFYNVDLTNADFTGATLKSTDLREANLTHTCWLNTIQLDQARPGKTILAETAVRKLLISGQGYKKSYSGCNLSGANLRGSNLNYANLKQADLSKATLEETNLEWANLTKTNCIDTDFNQAYFTGACLEAWNIDSTTRLTNVDCRFVYLLENPEPGTDNRERRPSSGDFQPGEFTKLFQEVLNTVDIIFRNGVDWKAFVAAFKKVQVENEDTELAIQSIENKGDGVVVVKVSVPPDTNKEKIHSDFTQNYELALKAVEEKYKAELKAKDDQIVIYREQSADLKEIIKIQASRPIQNMIDVTAKAENDMSDNSQSFNIDQSQATNPIVPVSNDNSRQEFNITNLTSEQTQSLAEAAAEIQQLLNQLSQTNPTTTSKEKMIVVSEVVDQIENNPTLKAKVINALKAGGVEAFKEAIDHPLVNILMATIDGWTEV
ncbi:pentapeptide repeat-containing protein [Moorena producens JHB]|uniref:Pentapeptide repeat-containing protein n=1 Tax=Moorena producens (strain JHB) TaxID=1454205 RepID=A0A1D9FVS1_MOOP1|nr:pentapeptide repeat-containing protein [Moorena producens]AOY79250.1 pentapeptide repeat-containing protein [Moorena producens JHB]